MSGTRLDKRQRKVLREKRRIRQNKRSNRAGEYGTGKTKDRKSDDE